MRPTHLVTQLLWLVPLFLFLAYLHKKSRGKTHAFLSILSAFVLSSSLFVFYKDKQPIAWGRFDTWLSIVVIGILLLPFIWSFRKKEEEDHTQKSVFFIAHPDILWLMFLFNGTMTWGLFSAYLQPLSGSFFSLLFYAGLYTCYTLLPLYLLYWIFFSLLPQKALRWVIWMESIRLVLVGLDLSSLLLVKQHIYTSQGIRWLFHWSNYPENSSWTNRHFIVVLLFALLSTQGLQITLQWLYLFLKRWSKKGLLSSEEIFEQEIKISSGLMHPILKKLSFLVAFAAFCASFVLLGLDPRVESELYAYLPGLEKIHFSLQRPDRNMALQMKLRKKNFSYPKKPTKQNVQRKPDILMLVVNSWGYDALQTSRMPRWIDQIQKQKMLISARHQGGTGEGGLGLNSLLRSVHSFRLDQLEGRPAWPLQKLKQLGYRIEALVPKNQALPSHIGFDRVTWLSKKRRAGKLLTLIQKKLQLSTTGVPSEKKRKRASSRPHPTTKKAQQRKPLFLLAVFDAISPKLKRKKENCYPYNSALGKLDKQLASLWNKKLQMRTQKNLAIVVTGESGWLSGEKQKGLDWVKHGSTPFLFFAPKLKQRSLRSSSHVDIFPTLFNYMKLQTSPSIYSDGNSLLRDDRNTALHVIGRPIPHTPGLALMSFPYSFFASWDRDMRFSSSYNWGYTGRKLQLPPRMLRRKLAQLQRKLTRFTPNLAFWSQRPPKLKVHHKKALFKPVVCAQPARLYQSRLYKKPFLVYTHNIQIEKHIKILGYEVENFTVPKGKRARIRITIEVLQPLGRWRFFVHLHGQKWFKNTFGEGFSQNPPKYWKKGEIVQGVVSFSYPGYFPVNVVVGLWAARGKKRGTVTGDPKKLRTRAHIVTLYPTKPSL